MDIDDATTRIVEPRVGRILWEGRLSIVPPQGVQVVFDSVEATILFDSVGATTLSCSTILIFFLFY